MICPICNEEATITQHETLEEFPDDITALTRYKSCDHCQSVYADADDMAFNKQQILIAVHEDPK